MTVSPEAPGVAWDGVARGYIPSEPLPVPPSVQLQDISTGAASSVAVTPDPSTPSNWPPELAASVVLVMIWTTGVAPVSGVPPWVNWM